MLNALRRIWPLLFLAAWGTAAAWPCAARAAQAGRLQVVATTSIIADWVKNVGGDAVDVATLVGPDGDPHEFQPAPSDSVELAQASLIFENGLGLEPWLDKLYDACGSTARRVIVSQGIAVRHVDEGGASDLDPHAWQSVKDAQTMVANIRDALIQADPANADGYRKRADDYIKQLQALDGWVMKEIHSLPPQRRKLVTSHDAFGYFGERYGMDISRSALESVTTEAADPSARQLAEVEAQIEASGVPVIFVENIQNPRLMQQIASDTGVRLGPPLYSDALGPPGSPGDTYIKMIHYNVDAMMKALKQ